MMCIKELYLKVTDKLDLGSDASMLFLRLMVAYTFYAPALSKLNDVGAIAGWFEGLGIPFPLLNAYMATGTEVLGVILLTLGLFTRFISIALIGVLSVAILTVHGVNGFHLLDESIRFSDAYVNGEMIKASLIGFNDGYELVLYYMLMLFALVTKGAGRLSLDFLLFKKA